MSTVPRTGNIREDVGHNQRLNLAQMVIRYAGAIDLGILVIVAMSGAHIGQVAPAGITTAGAIMLAAIGVAGASLRGLPRQPRT